MAKSRRRSIYPILLIALVNGLVFAGTMVPLAYYGFEEGPPVDLGAAGWVGWTSLVLAVAGLAISIVGGVLLRAIPKIPALTMAVYPASVAVVGLIGAQLGAGTVLGAASGIDPGQGARLVGTGMSEALNATVITSYVAAMLLMGGALTIALRHWPSRSSLSSGGKLGLIGGGFLLIGMIVGSFFWQPLGGLGFLPWITVAGGLVAIAMAAHAIRNDPTDEANLQAAGELWVTLLLAVGALVFVCTARHTGILMEGLAVLRSADGQPDLTPMVEAWTAAGPALYGSALYAVPLLFAAVSSMLSRESLGSWGLRQAAASLFVVPIFFVAPSLIAFVQTSWAAGQVAKRTKCSPHALSNPDLTIPVVPAGGKPSCPALALEVGHSKIMIGDTEVGAVKDLGSPEGCEKVAESIDATGMRDKGVLIADASLSYRRAACLASALAKQPSSRQFTVMYQRLHPDVVGREGAVFHWIVKGTSREVDKARAPFDDLGTTLLAVPAFGPVQEGWDDKLVLLHVFEGGWEVQRAPGAKGIRFDGTPEEGIERLKKTLGLRFDQQPVVVRGDGSVRMGVVLHYASHLAHPQLALPTPIPGSSAAPPGSAGSAVPPGSAGSADSAGSAAPAVPSVSSAPASSL